MIDIEVIKIVFKIVNIGLISVEVWFYINVFVLFIFFCDSGIDIVVFFGKFWILIFKVSIIVVIVVVLIDLVVVLIVLNVILIVSFLGMLCSVMEKINKIDFFILVVIFFVIFFLLKCICGIILFVVNKKILFKLNLIVVIN